MLAITNACQGWKYYVKDATNLVVVITNNANLQRFLVNKQLNRRDTQWWEQISR